jgi:hypothetical protein
VADPKPPKLWVIESLTGRLRLFALGRTRMSASCDNHGRHDPTRSKQLPCNDGPVRDLRHRQQRDPRGYSLGQVGTDWQFVGLRPFYGSDTTDMLLRSASTGGFEVYDISNNNITNAAFLGNVGLDWQVMGFGNFSSRGESDMIMRNSNTGGVEVYDISNNQITGAAFMGAVGLNWQFSGVGNPGYDQRYLTICGSLACCGAPSPCKHSSRSASARSSCSKRKCCSRDSGDRHIPAKRWCSAAITRYSLALIIVSSHASSLRPAGAGANGVGRSNGSPELVLERKARTLCVGVSSGVSLHLHGDKVERVSPSPVLRIPMPALPVSPSVAGPRTTRCSPP